jgi:hypothetical protein
MLTSSILIVLFSPFIFAAALQSVYEIQVKNEFLASNTPLTCVHRLAIDAVYRSLTVLDQRTELVLIIQFFGKEQELVLLNI